MAGLEKACPFCGSTDVDDDEGNWPEGTCVRCGATGPRCTEGNWRWDDRTPGPATKLVLDAFAAAARTPTTIESFKVKVVSLGFSEDQARAFLEEWGRGT